MYQQSSSFFILHVNKITPPTLRPFEKIISQVTNSWKYKNQTEQGENQAKKLVNKLNNSMPITQLAKNLDIDLIVTKPFKRTGEGLESALPTELIAKVFDSQINKAVWASGDGMHLIAYVSEVRQPVTSDIRSIKDKLRNQLKQSISIDLKNQLAEALRSRLGVEINRESIKQIYSGKDNE